MHLDLNNLSKIRKFYASLCDFYQTEILGNYTVVYMQANAIQQPMIGFGLAYENSGKNFDTHDFNKNPAPNFGAGFRKKAYVIFYNMRIRL